MKWKFAPFCSYLNAFSDGILFCRSQNFKILAENHDYKSMVLIKFLSALISSLEGAMKLKFAPFCSY